MLKKFHPLVSLIKSYYNYNILILILFVSCVNKADKQNEINDIISLSTNRILKNKSKIILPPILGRNIERNSKVIVMYDSIKKFDIRISTQFNYIVCDSVFEESIETSNGLEYKGDLGKEVVTIDKLYKIKHPFDKKELLKVKYFDYITENMFSDYTIDFMISYSVLKMNIEHSRAILYYKIYYEYKHPSSNFMILSKKNGEWQFE